MMMNDIEESGRNYAITLTKTLVLPKIVKHLDTKFPGCGISVEELMSVVGGDTTHPDRSNSSESSSHSPGVALEGPAPSVSTSASSSTRKPTSKISSVSKKDKPDYIYDKPEEGVKCIHMYTRGPRNGTYCGKPCAEGLKYCKYCKNKKKRNPTTGRSSSKSKTPAKKKEEETLTVEVYHNLEKYFLHPETNFILHEDDQTICAIAKELESGKLRSLTEEEKTEARKSTLVTITDADKEAEALATLKGLIGEGEEAEGEEKEEEEAEVDISPKSIPTAEEPLITKTPVPVIPEVPEVPSI